MFCGMTSRLGVASNFYRSVRLIRKVLHDLQHAVSIMVL